MHKKTKKDKSMTEKKKYLNVPQAAAFLEYSVAHVYKLVNCHKLPYTKYGRRVLFDENRLAEWKSARMVEFPTLAEMESRSYLP